MQVFFEKNSNFLCICSNTRNCSELTSKCIPNHTLFLFLLYNTIYPHPTASQKHLSSASLHPYQKLHLIDIQFNCIYIL